MADTEDTADITDTAKTEDGAGKTGTRQGRGLTVPSNPAMALRRLNAQHGSNPHSEHEEADPDKPADKQSEQQTTKQTNNTTDPQNSVTDASPVQGKDDPQGAAAIAASPQTGATPALRRTNSARNKQTEKQTNNTTTRSQLAAGVAEPPAGKRDGRTQRIRQNLAGAEATVITSFRILATTMEELDEFCFRNRMRKQDVVQQALEAFLAGFDADGED